MSRTATAILSTKNLLHNLQIIKSHANGSKIIAMVKANAYGHGIRSVSLRLDGHVDLLGVASIDEALALRKVGVKTPIMLMEGVFEASELLEASAHQFHVVFNNTTQLEWLKRMSLPLKLNTWIKINTGMNRLGFSPQEGRIHYDNLLSYKNVAHPVNIMSHFACSDEKDHPLNQTQISAFKNFIAQLPNSQVSFCNSAGIFNFPDCQYDYVRPGLALYGVSPIAGISAAALNLKPVMTLQTSIISIQKAQKGSTVGYGGRFICPEDGMPIGIIAFGYGDGYPITARDGTPILINNTLCPLIGRVSMDMIAVDLSKCPDAQVGDQAILWGEGLPIQEVVEHTSAIAWSLLTGVQNRVKFLWTHERNF